MYEYRNLTPAERDAVVRRRLERGFPPHDPPHPIRDGLHYFLTAACYEHRPHMQTQARRASLLEIIQEQATLRGICLRAWVILPNHYHLLAAVSKFNALSELFRHVHGRTARRWNLEDREPGRKVWYKYSDRAIRSVRHYAVTLNYIHYNPVKHRWTRSPYDWRESSIHWYEATYGRDWLRALWRSYPVRKYGRSWDR